MKKIIILLVAALALLPSCKKKQQENTFSIIGKQWLLTDSEGNKQIYDFSTESGCYFLLGAFWKDLPDATYLVDEHSIYPYAVVPAEDCFRINVEVVGDGTPESSLYEEYYDITEKTFSLRSIYHDSSRDITENWQGSVVEKPVKVIRTPLKYIGLRKGGYYPSLRTPEKVRKRFIQMGKEQSAWQVIVLGKEGYEGDYADVDVNGKIVAVTHSFDEPKSEPLTPTQKLTIAAAKGASAIFFIYEQKQPMSLEQFNTLPSDDASIPYAIAGYEFKADTYNIITED